LNQDSGPTGSLAVLQDEFQDIGGWGEEFTFDGLLEGLSEANANSVVMSKPFGPLIILFTDEDDSGDRRGDRLWETLSPLLGNRSRWEGVAGIGVYFPITQHGSSKISQPINCNGRNENDSPAYQIESFLRSTGNYMANSNGSERLHICDPELAQKLKNSVDEYAHKVSYSLNRNNSVKIVASHSMALPKSIARLLPTASEIRVVLAGRELPDGATPEKFFTRLDTTQSIGRRL
jgi:hypothetical protein